MASDTIVPGQSTDEHEEKKENDTIQNVERENVYQSKRNGGIDEEEKVDVDVEGSASGEAAVTELEKKIDDEKNNVPPVVEATNVEEIEKALGSDGPKAAEGSNQTLIISDVPENAVEVTGKESEEQPEISDVPGSSTTEAAVKKPIEHAEVSATEESEVKSGKQPEVSQSATEIVDKPKENSETSAVLGSAPEDEVKPEYPSDMSDDPKSVPEKEEKREDKSTISVAAELAEVEVEKKIETLEAKESAADEVPKDGKSSTDKVEVEADSFKEELPVVEKECLVDGSNKFENVIRILDANAGIEDTKKQERDTDAVEVLLKEVAVEAGLPNSPVTGLIKDIGTAPVTEIAENLMTVENKVKEKVEENVETDELVLTEATKTMDVSVLNSATEVTKDSFEEKTSGDVEKITEEKEKKIVKGDVPTSVETSRDSHVEGADANKPIEKPQETELEGKAAEAIEATVNKLEKAEEKNEEAPKSPALNLVDSSKDGNDKETAGEVTKQEVIPAKPAHRQSNSIISKVKQSIVKVKKAIIGKSPSSKTLSSEAKCEQ